MSRNLHSKAKGALGEIAVAKDLLAQSYQVFVELGDNSKVDLIVLGSDFLPIKVQVKSLFSRKGAVVVNVTKSGPSYQFRYQRLHVDVFAIYVPDKDLIAYVNADRLLQQRKSLTLRVDPAVNNQSRGISWLADYSEFQKALRGHTQRTQTAAAAGEEMVQTATELRALAGES